MCRRRGDHQRMRLDHTEEMGETLDEIAEALSHTIPEGGTLFSRTRPTATFSPARPGKRERWLSCPTCCPASKRSFR